MGYLASYQHLKRRRRKTNLERKRGEQHFITTTTISIFLLRFFYSPGRLSGETHKLYEFDFESFGTLRTAFDDWVGHGVELMPTRP